VTKVGPEVKGACYRISRNLICAIEFAYRLYRAWVGAALLQFGFDVFGRFRISATAKFASGSLEWPTRKQSCST